MPTATWEGAAVARSDDTVVVEGNHYFPPEALRQQYFVPSDTQTICPWKGTAQYYHLDVNGKRNQDAAWYYADPKPEAAEIKNRVAFWKGVQVRP